MEIINEKGPRKLYRSRNKVIGGVCQGLADYLNVDVTLVRVVAAAALFMPLVPAFLPYLVMWIIVPMEP